MPRTVSSEIARVLRSFNTTDAFAGCSVRPNNAFCLPARCAPAHRRTSASEAMVRAISPSRARLKLTCSRNSVAPNAVRSKISKPIRPDAGIPWLAKRESQLVELRRRHADGAPAGVELVADLVALQILDHHGGRFGVEV